MKTFKFNIIVTKLHYYFLLGLCTLLFSAGIMAQASFVTRVQAKKVGKGDPFRVEYVIENVSEVSRFREPEFPDFVILQGPSQGNTTSIVNGKVSQYIYVSYILQAKKTGKFVIPGASAVIDGKKLQSNSITMEIVAGSVGRQPLAGITPPAPKFWDEEEKPVNREIYLKPGENALDKIRDNLFVKTTCDRTSCYVGEPIVASFKLYTRLQSESKVTKRPSLNGFSVYDMLDPESPATHKETINGKDYNVYYIRKAQLYPLQPGSITLEPVEIENKVVFYKPGIEPARNRSRRTMDDILREYFGESQGEESGGAPEEHNLSLSSKPVTVSVLPLPVENKPANFSGAVGKFTIDASLTGAGPQTGKASKIVVVISGEGNLPMITAPAVQWPESFETFDPLVKEELDKSVSPIKGRKVFEYTFSPNAEGAFTIPAIHFSYFDTKEKKYHEISTPSINLDVKKGVLNPNQGTGPVENKQDDPLFSQSSVIQLLMGITLLLISIIAYFTWMGNRKNKTKVVRHPVIEPVIESAAPIVVPEPVPTPVKKETVISWAPVEAALAKGDSQQFYTLLGNTIWQFLNEKLELTGSEKNKHTLLQKLSAIPAVTTAETEKLTKTLQACELALYSPVHSEEDMQTLFTETEVLLNTLAPKLN